MKTFLKILKWIGIVLGTFIIILVIAVYARQSRKFDAPYPDIHASKDSAVIARGEYLAYGPAHCAQCHAPKEDVEKINAGQHVPLRGGFEFVTPIGTIRSPNITSDSETGIGSWSDPEIARALRYEVAKTGIAVFDFMPFQNLSDEDLTAIISFIRSQKPVQNTVKRMDLNFLGKTVNAFVIKPVGPNGDIPKSVAPDTNAAYGSYLAYSISNCKGCHTERSQMTGAYTGPLFAGGGMFEHPESGFTLITPNLTPDKKTGRIADWSMETFINRFRQGRLIKESDMPWDQFKQMSDDDLKAIYRFLTSLEPVSRDNGPAIHMSNP